MRFACGELGSGNSAVGCVPAGWALSVGALDVDALALMVVEGQHWQQHHHLRMFVVVVCIENWQKSVRSWEPVIRLTETHTAWPVASLMS